MRRSPTIALLAVVLCGGLAACGGDSDTETADASASPSAAESKAASSSSSSSVAEAPTNKASDGTLLIYSGRQKALVGPILEKFEKESGIDIEVRYGDTAELAAQLIEEGTRTDADVFFSQDGGALGALSERGRFDKIPQDVLDRVPAQYRADDGKWIGTSGRSRVLVYDPKQLSEEKVPDSIFDLTKPEWKGKVGIAPTNASFQSFVTGIRVAKGDNAARDWLKGIKANEPKIYDNNIAILNAAEDGIISVGLINHYYWFEQVAEEGIEKVPARLKFLPNGDPGALVNVAGAGVLAGSDQAAAAQNLVAYLVSDAAQKEFADHLKEYPLVKNIPLPKDLPSLDSLEPPDIDLSDLDTLEETLAMLEDAGLT